MDPAWRLTRWPIASIGVAIVAGWCVHEYVALIASLGGGSQVQREVRVKLPLAEARKRIEQSVQAEINFGGNPGEVREGWKGFVLGEAGEWRMNTVPEGKAIGTVAFLNAWQGSPFDRWRWRKGCLRASTPQIQILFIASDEPIETKVRVTICWPNVVLPQPETNELARILVSAVDS
jgi:hypothetical protein